MPFRKLEINAAVADLSYIVKELGWGHNKLIRNGGIRITDEIKPWKEWTIIKDPNFFIEEDCFIGKGKLVARIIFKHGIKEY